MLFVVTDNKTELKKKKGILGLYAMILKKKKKRTLKKSLV